MASSSCEEELHFMQCCTCLNQFTQDRAPQLLPCLHATCSQCLDKAVKGISCPRCPDSLLTVPASVQLDLVRWNELVISNIKEKNHAALLCSNKADGEPATHYCQECVCLLCSNCFDVHQQLAMTRKHSTCLLDDIAKSDSTETLTCPDHPDDVLRYSVDKKSMTCRQCTIIDTECTEGADADVKGSKSEEALVKSLVALKSNLTQVEDSLTALESQNESIKESETVVTKQVYSVFSLLQEQIESRRNRLLSKIKNEFENMTSYNSDRSARLDSVSRRWRTTVDYCERALTFNLRSHVTGYRDVITRKLESELKVAPVDIKTHSCEDVFVDFSPGVLHSVETKIHSVGSIVVRFKHIVCIFTKAPKVGSYETFATLRFETQTQRAESDVGSRNVRSESTSSNTVHAPGGSSTLHYADEASLVSIADITAHVSGQTNKLQCCHVHKIAECEEVTYAISARLLLSGKHTLTTEVKCLGFAESVDLQASYAATREDGELLLCRLMTAQLPKKTRIKQLSLTFDMETINTKFICLQEDGTLTNKLPGYWTNLTRPKSSRSFNNFTGAVASRQLPRHGTVYWEVEFSWMKIDEDADSISVIELAIVDPNHVNSSVGLLGKTNWGVSLYYSKMYDGMCLVPSSVKAGNIKELHDVLTCRLAFLLNMDLRKMYILDVKSDKVVAVFDEIDTIIPLCFATGLFNGRVIESSVRIISGWKLHPKMSTMKLVLRLLDKMSMNQDYPS